MRLIHFRSYALSESQPLSRVRSVWIPEDPLGKVIHNRPVGLKALAVRPIFASSSSLFFTKSWIRSGRPESFSETEVPGGRLRERT